jgi:hypothetical protein
MIELSQFGTIIQKYTGNGQLSRKGYGPEGCSFEAGQFSDGEIIIICAISDIIFDGKDDEITLVGITSDGQNFMANGYAIQNRYSVNLSHEREAPVQIVLRSSGEFHLGLGDADWQGHASIHFYATNFKFTGMHTEEIEPNHWRLNHIKLNLDSRDITLRQMDNYEQRIKQIEDKHETDITAEFVIEINRDDLLETFNLISVLCDLLSIARGKRINWIYYDVLIDGAQVYREHQPLIVTPFAGFEVIDHMPPKNTVYFLQTCYPHYVKLDTMFRFLNVTNIYTAVRSGGFIETRCLAAFSLVEYLAKKVTTPPTPPGRKREPEFRQWLEAIINEYHVPIDPTEITSFVKIRNSLVHEMKFLPSDPQEQYFQVMHFLDRILLRILGYDSYYLPATELNQWAGANKFKLTPTS